MKLSVIIPTYKPDKYIFQCLESLKSQTLDSSLFEIILILNGCNEPWDSRLQSYIKRELSDLNINYIKTSVPGVSHARNLGISSSKGEYLTFIDDDDYISSCYLEELLDKANPNSIVLADSRAFYDGENVFFNNYPPHDAFISCSTMNDQSLLHARAIFNGPCMKALPSAFIQGLSFNESLTIGEDGLFMFQISRHIKSVVYTSQNAIYFRRYRRNSLTTCKKNKAFIIKNTSKRLVEYTTSWLKSPFSYNFPFFLSRILATIKGALLSL